MIEKQQFYFKHIPSFPALCFSLVLKTISIQFVQTLLNTTLGNKLKTFAVRIPISSNDLHTL